eukprot:COSAG06_NODE_4342_length_4354_cov_84.610150_3_plen_84_part_00
MLWNRRPELVLEKANTFELLISTKLHSNESDYRGLKSVVVLSCFYTPEVAGTPEVANVREVKRSVLALQRGRKRLTKARSQVF